MLVPAVIVAAPALIAGALAGVAAVVAGLHFAVVLPTVVVVVALASLWLWRRAPQAVLEMMNAQPLVSGSHISLQRFENTVKHLCTAHGMTEPNLHIADISDVHREVVNAASVGLGRKSAHLVLTRNAISRLDRLELEAVVARELCEIRRGRDVATALARVAGLPGCRRLATLIVGLIVGRWSEASADIEAVHLTCYPPALASAIEKSAASLQAGAPLAVAHLWMVPTESETASGNERLPATLRVDMLGEL